MTCSTLCLNKVDISVMAYLKVETREINVALYILYLLSVDLIYCVIGISLPQIVSPDWI